MSDLIPAKHMPQILQQTHCHVNKYVSMQSVASAQLPQVDNAMLQTEQAALEPWPWCQCDAIMQEDAPSLCVASEHQRMLQKQL